MSDEGTPGARFDLTGKVALITGGSRGLGHAMALGFAGFAVTIDSPWLVALVVPFMAVIHLGVVKREERYLENKFGDVYRRYRATVRRWI